MKEQWHCFKQAVSNAPNYAKVEHDIALELNTSGKDKDFREFLPCDALWAISREYPLKRVLGSDAHSPEHVGRYFGEV